MGSILKVIAFVILVLTVAGGIITGFATGSFAAFIMSCISGCVSFAVIYGIGDILEKVDDIRYRLSVTEHEIKELRKKLAPEDESEKPVVSNSRFSFSGSNSAVSADAYKKPVNTWDCPKCKCRNSNFDSVCKICGAEKYEDNQ